MILLLPSLSLTKRREKHKYEDDDEGVEKRCFVVDFLGKKLMSFWWGRRELRKRQEEEKFEGEMEVGFSILILAGGA